MADNAALVAAIARLNTDVTAVLQAVAAALQKMSTAGGATSAQLDDAITQINKVSATIEAETAALSPNA